MPSSSISCLLLAILVNSARTLLAGPLQPPVPKQVEHVSIWHGEKVNDPYFWLREKTNPAVSAYLEAENAYTAAMTKELQPFSDVLYKEMLGRIKQTDLSVPTRDGVTTTTPAPKRASNTPSIAGGRCPAPAPMMKRLPK